MELLFTEAESTFSYFEAAEHDLAQYDKPLAFYSDKLSVFRINPPNDLSGSGMTQFGRAMRQLDIDVVCANTPQAKGRVERVNQTLQDRLVKEMQFQNVSGRQAGHAYLPEFMADFNTRFAGVPRQPQDAHRSLLPKDDLARILTVQETRVLSKNLPLNYAKRIYQIQTPRPTYALRKATVSVCENRHGEIAIEYKGKPLAYRVYLRQEHQCEVVSSKQLTLAVDQLAPKKKRHQPQVPSPDHPWRRFKAGKPKPSELHPPR